MKKLMKIVAVAAMMLAATNAFAQLEVGFGFASETYRQTDPDLNAKNWNSSFDAYGFYAGVAYGIQIVPNFKITPGLYYSMTSANKGYIVADGKKTEYNFKDDDAKTGPMVHHDLSLPILFSYSIPAGPVKITPFLGPNLLFNIETAFENKSAMFKEAYGTTSNSYYKIYGMELSGDGVKGTVKNNPDLSRFDVQGQVGLAIEIMDLFVVKGGYNFGFLDRNKDKDVILHSNSWFIGVAVTL